jgi:polysaccharide pyruvyl transferase WcaK-like protein
MTQTGSSFRHGDDRHAPRIGLFGLLGSGNSGNEASMESVLAYLHRDHPEAVLDAMCGGSERVREVHDIDAVPFSLNDKYRRLPLGPARILLRILGKLADPVRIVVWVRRHDAVIVPGAGALEATLPVRAYGFPFALFVLCISGKIFGVRVALVSVGADMIKKPTTRLLSNAAARFASYRSYRDAYSMNAMRERGIDVAQDRLFPDLVFGVPTPRYDPGDPQLVGVGLMDYKGGNDDWNRADELHSTYIANMTAFVRWLIDNNYNVWLFGGDAKFDYAVVDDVKARVSQAAGLPDSSARIVVKSFSSYSEMLSGMNGVGSVVATRYHNVMCALKLCKPTIAIGYSQKFVALMDSMGVAQFTHFADKLDVDQLILRFQDLQDGREELLAEMRKRNNANADDMAEQFALLSTVLFPGSVPPGQSGALTNPQRR